MFDAANRKTLQYETWGDKRAVQYAYDSNGNRTHVRRGYMNDAKFVLLDGTEHVYNRRNHLIKTMPNVQPNPNARRNIWYGYDSLGRRTVVQEGGMQETTPGSGTYFETTLRSTVTYYDSNDNPTTFITYQGEADNPNTWTEINRTERLYDARNLVSQSIDPNGTPTTYTHDPLGRVFTTSTYITNANNNAVPHITDVTFDDMGNQVLVKSIVGTTEVGRNEYGYNLRNERVRHENALGYVHSFAFDGNGNVIEATDPAGNVTRTYFDALNRVSANENALGHTTRRAYDANSNLVATISPLNERTTFEYNANNELITTIDPVGNTTRYYFDKRGRQLLIQSPRHPGGIVDPYAEPPVLWTTRTDYNAFDEPFMVRTPVTLVDDSVAMVQTSSLFDALGRVISVTDARGTVTETDYDALDRVVEIRQAPGQAEETVTRNYFDSNGNPLLSIRAFGTPEQVATYSRFDEANRAVATTIGALQASFDPMNLNPSTDAPASIFKPNEFLTTTTAYFDNERRVDVSDPYGMTASTVTDALGRTVSATDKAGYTTRFFYDSRNNLVQTQFPNGSPDAPIIKTYDALNRVIQTSQAGDTTGSEFDASGRLIKETDARGYVTRHVYDKASRLIRTTRAVGTAEQATTKFAYDAANNRTTIIDANHSLAYASGVTANEIPIASYEFDELNRVVREWDASGNTGATDGEISYYHDNGGLPIATYKRDGLVVGRLFDRLGRPLLVQTEYQNNPPVIQQEFRYDALSRMTDVTDYNADFITGVSSAEHTVNYTYDFASRVTDELTYDSDLHNPISGRTVNTTWGLAAAPDLSQQITKNYPYGSRGQIRKLDERGQLRFIGDLNAVQIAAFDYDSMSRPISSEIRNASSVTVMTGSATFDNRGREQNRVLQNGSTHFLNQSTGFDASSNVDHETFAGLLPVVSGFKDYTNDPLNRLTHQDNPGTTLDLNWTLDLEGNWLSTNQNGSVENRTVNDDNESNDIGSKIVDYDSNGNIVRYGDLAFSYDWAERMTEARNVSGGLPGTVFAFYSYDAANRRIKKTYDGVTTTYIYDGGQVVQELENGMLARTFIYGSYIDAPVVMYDELNSGTQYFYVRDRRANIVGLLDSSSSVVERMEYSPFGTWTIYNAAGVEIAGSTVGNPYGFTGRRWDAESSLWYYRNRIYSAELGRFLSRDPAGFIDGWNVYAYVTNNPLRFVDPLGLLEQEITFGSLFGSLVEALAHDNQRGQEPMITNFYRKDGVWYINNIVARRESYHTVYSHDSQLHSADAISAFGTGLETGAVATTNGVYIGGAEIITLGSYQATQESWRPISITNYMNEPGYFQAEGVASGTIQIAASIGTGVAAQTGNLLGKGAFIYDTAFNVSSTIQGAVDIAIDGANADNLSQTALGALGVSINTSVIRSGILNTSDAGVDLALSGRQAEQAVSSLTGARLNSMGDNRISIPGSGRGGVRYPDLNPQDTFPDIIDVKDLSPTSTVTKTPQIADFVAEAENNQGTFILYTNAQEPSRGFVFDALESGTMRLEPLPSGGGRFRTSDANNLTIAGIATGTTAGIGLSVDDIASATVNDEGLGSINLNTHILDGGQSASFVDRRRHANPRANGYFEPRRTFQRSRSLSKILFD